MEILQPSAAPQCRWDAARELVVVEPQRDHSRAIAHRVWYGTYDALRKACMRARVRSVRAQRACAYAPYARVRCMSICTLACVRARAYACARAFTCMRTFVRSNTRALANTRVFWRACVYISTRAGCAAFVTYGACVRSKAEMPEKELPQRLALFSSEQ